MLPTIITLVPLSSHSQSCKEVTRPRLEDYLRITIETYNQITNQYVENTRNRQPQLEFIAFCREVVSQGVVVDGGCGWGRDCQHLAKQGFTVIGIDLSDEMLRLAKAWVPDCTFIQADLRHIPCEDHSIDGIWCCASLVHLKRSQVGQALSEFRRVLKIDAPCCIIVKEGLGEEMVEYSQGRFRFFTYFQQEEIRNQCLAAGFDILDESVGSTNSSRASGQRGQNWIYLLMKR
jgi:ubiquinone/menaquinone biosynthesis C-methylase UbiE